MNLALRMARKKIYRTDEYPYHISSRCLNREWFAVPMPTVWRIFEDYLHFISHAYQVEIHSFVLMNNHFHMLARTPEANLGRAMNYLLREVSRRVGEESGRINQIFGGPYHWTVIKNSIYYQHAYKYIYRNPVHAGICKSVEDYPYSSLPGLLGLAKLNIPVFDNLYLIQDTYRQLAWLNCDYSEEHRLAIRTALHHREFCFPIDPQTQKLNPLENLIV